MAAIVLVFGQFSVVFGLQNVNHRAEFPDMSAIKEPKNLNKKRQIGRETEVVAAEAGVLSFKRQFSIRSTLFFIIAFKHNINRLNRLLKLYYISKGGHLSRYDHFIAPRKIIPLAEGKGSVILYEPSQ